MQLKVFKTTWGFPNWGNEESLDLALGQCVAAGFHGLETPVPETSEARRLLRQKLDARGLDFIGEVCTAGSYVPRRDASLEEHLQSFQMHVENAGEIAPLFVSSMAGCDAWTVAQSVEFFGKAHEIAQSCGVMVSFETHRGRSFFNPWTTRDILLQLPELRITCDFSHWCVVCERLIDSEPDVLELCFKRAKHIHARVGFSQGAQVCDPRAPEFKAELEAHERWWTSIWDALQARGKDVATMTPEFGPDGYMPRLPYTLMPLGDLESINVWMGQRQQSRFQNRMSQL